MNQYKNTSETLYVTGPPSTGKTTLVKEFIQKHFKLHVYIDCAGLSSSSQLFCDIIRGLADNLDASAQYSSIFVTTLLDLLSKKRVKKYVIVLDNAHRLNTSQFQNSIALLLHLDEYIDEPTDDYKKRHHIQLIFITSIALRIFAEFHPPKIRDKLVRRCKVVALAPWTKSELIERIASCEPTRRADLYPTMVNNIVNLYYKDKTKDYLDLKYLCEREFERFIDQFENEKIDMRFFKHKKFSSDMNKLLDPIKYPFKREEAMSMDMMLLITGAYIASFSNSKDDQVNFVKSNAKTKRRKIQTIDFCQNIKNFTLERLLQIYKRLCDPTIHERLDNPKRDDLPDSVLASIRILVDLNFFRNVGEFGLSGTTKLAIADYIDYNYAKWIAKNCDIELDNYLR